MRKWIGATCIFLGIICMLCAAGFVVYNQWEDKNAEQTAQVLLAEVQSIIDAPQSELPKEPVHRPDALGKTPAEMNTIKVDGYDCIGILSIPALNLELPVLQDWSYEKLKKAPCHYYGTYYEKDFVIAAHNYKSHFGRLSELQAGDIVIFTDTNSVDHYYQVALLETLQKGATKEMITSGFDLSLYTCTTGGASRVTVRCNAV